MHPLLGETKQSQFPCPATAKYPLSARASRRAGDVQTPLDQSAHHTNLSGWSGSLGSLVQLFPKTMEARIQTEQQFPITPGKIRKRDNWVTEILP